MSDCPIARSMQVINKVRTLLNPRKWDGLYVEPCCGYSASAWEDKKSDIAQHMFETIKRIRLDVTNDIRDTQEHRDMKDALADCLRMLGRYDRYVHEVDYWNKYDAGIFKHGSIFSL